MKFRAALLVLPVALLGLTPSEAFGQFGPSRTLIRSATVFGEDGPIENCDLLLVGDKIRDVGPALVTPDGAEVIDAKGRFIIPTLIDAATTVGLEGASSRERPEHRAADRIDLFDRDPFEDALAEGVAYAYLRGVAASGPGGSGTAIRIPRRTDRKLEDVLLAGTEAIHFRVGSSGNGPLARLNELLVLRRSLEATQKYKKAWEKYREDLEKYEKELAEWAKKRPAKTESSGDAKKKDAAEAPKEEADPKRSRRRRPPRSLPPGIFGGPAVHIPTVSHLSTTSGTPDESAPEAPTFGPYDAAVVHRHDHEHGVPEPLRFAPELHPRYSNPDRGTEPHQTYAAAPIQDDPIPERTILCPSCAGLSPAEAAGIPGHLHDEPGFDFWQFAPAEDDEEKKEEAKPDAEKKPESSKDDKAPKKPREPRFDPMQEAMIPLLEGKVGARIEVHRAEDLLQVLDLLDDFPMEAVLEGATEGYLVADRIAAAGVPVVVHAEAIAPPQEDESGSRRVFRSGNFFFGGGFSTYRAPVEGYARSGNAAALRRAGVTVAIGSLADGGASTPQLRLRAAFAAGHGLSTADAIRLVTADAAAILGIGDRVGTLAKGKLASFLVLDGDPLSTASTIERVVVEGDTVFKK